jgi:hypothetical protein
MLLALLLLLAPAAGLTGHPVLVAQTPEPQIYRVEFRPRLQAFGYTGELRLFVSHDGYVNGTYRADTGGHMGTVRGGHQGNRLWFDVQTLGGLHVEATMKGAGMSGVAAPTGMSNQEYIFTATPEGAPPG